MRVTVSFYSYFKDLVGAPKLELSLPDDSSLGDLLDLLSTRFPRLAKMKKSMLTAVGVEYENRSRVLKEGDEVSLFPPVQGG
jgi:sulfur-carrier protein